MTSFLIGERAVGPDAPPLVIAEMSGNHNQSLDRAFGACGCCGSFRCPCTQVADLYGGHHHL